MDTLGKEAIGNRDLYSEKLKKKKNLNVELANVLLLFVVFFSPLMFLSYSMSQNPDFLNSLKMDVSLFVSKPL